MPQVFGGSELGLISMASLWSEAASAEDIVRATHPQVAAEAIARGLVPKRMGADPIWHHPETGESTVLAPAHSGDSALYTRINNDLAELRRRFPTEQERARASRSPEEIEADSAAAAAVTRSKKQQAVDAARRAKQQAFLKDHAPFASMDEIQAAFDARSEKARAARPDDTVDQFAERLRALPKQTRRQVHQTVFPERY